MKYTYMTISEITDFGPCITHLILHMPEKIDSKAISNDLFNVYVERKDQNTGEILNLKKDWNSDATYQSKGYRNVNDTYVSDENGNRLDFGNFITLKMEVHPALPLSSEIAFVHPHNVYCLCDYRITQIGAIQAENSIISGLIFTKCSQVTRKHLKGWTNSTSTHPEQPLGYGYFTPTTKTTKIPLIIWLHGAGEGGSDPTVAYTGNEVVNLASESIQTFFGGAYVLAPQSPTMWMDDGTGQYTKSGKSKYTAALKYLIDEFIVLNADIDTTRIYLGGCSNGGFMTLRMIIDYPNFFAAAYPVCEALFDEVISDTDIEIMKNMPIWFTHTVNDPVLKPELTVTPTIERLAKAGAKNIHLSMYPNVVDTSGMYKDAEGNPYEYHGHFSWIYTLNNECSLDFEQKRVTIFEWLSMQTM